LQPAATVGLAWLGYCRRHGIIMRIVIIIIKKIVGRERFGRSTPAMSRGRLIVQDKYGGPSVQIAPVPYHRLAAVP
ncbi:MAG TPA: hypothetical protein VFZ67_00005, partial [Nitrososphaera sp.]